MKINKKYCLIPVLMIFAILFLYSTCYAEDGCKHESLALIKWDDSIDGGHYFRCIDCGATIREAHIITFTPNNNATCTEYGTCKYACNVCPCRGVLEYYEEPLGHSLKKTEGKAASCTEAGYEAYWTCERCGKLFSDEAGTVEIGNTIEIKAAGHDLEKVAKKEASCTESGYETYWMCERCGKLFSDEAGTVEISNPKEIKATGHDLEKVAKKEASCTEAGYEAYWKCKTCGKLFSDEAGTEEISKPEEIKVTGHDLEKVDRKNASCTETGYEAYWKCKTCGKLFSDETGKTEIKEPEEIKATGHSYGEATYKWSADNQKCTAERKCTACGNVESETADATAKVVQEKNCTLPELTTYSATFKNDAFKPQTKENVQTSDAIGHNLEKVAKKEASCTETGYEEYWECKACGKLFSDEAGTEEISNSIEIKATGHDLEKVDQKNASCTETGYEEYWKCKTCGKLFSDEVGKTEIKEPEEIKATGHSYGDAAYKWSADNQKCTAERKCTACGNVESETTDATAKVVQEKNCTLPELTTYSVTFKNDAFKSQTKENVQTADAIGHDLKKVQEQSATAAKEGNSTYWFCNKCNKYFSDKKAKNEIKKEDTVLAKLAPAIIKGDGATVTAGEKTTLSFTSDAAYEDFIRVEVDGKTINEGNYTVKSGSTIVTLKEEYVASLSEGEHTLGIVSESGTATAHFTVSKKTTEPQASSAKTTNTTQVAGTTYKTTRFTPKTGDSTDLQLYVILILASIGVAGVGVKRKLKTRR